MSSVRIAWGHMLTGRYNPLKSPSSALNSDASITSPLLNANLFFHSLLLSHWKKPLRKPIFFTRIDFTAHFQIVLSCSIVLNVLQPAKVHQVSQITAAWNAQSARGSSVWIVEFLGILLWAVRSSKTSHWKREMLQILPYTAWHKIKAGGVASSAAGWLSSLKVATTWHAGKITYLNILWFL